MSFSGLFGIAVVVTLATVGLTFTMSNTANADYPKEACVDIVLEQRKVIEESGNNWREDAWFVKQYTAYGCHFDFESPEIALFEFEFTDKRYTNEVRERGAMR